MRDAPTFDEILRAADRETYAALVEFVSGSAGGPRLLLVDGLAGSGKTYLLRGIEQAFRAQAPDAPIACLTGDAVSTHMVQAIVDDSEPTLIERFTSCRLVLIDDLFTVTRRRLMSRELRAAIHAWLRTDIRVAGAGIESDEAVLRLTGGVCPVPWRRITVGPMTEHQMVRFLRERAPALERSTLCRIARESGGNAGQAIRRLDEFRFRLV